jgi:exosortase
MDRTKKIFPLKIWLSFSTLIISFILLYYHSVIKMIQDWATDDNYSHGFIVPFIVGYLVWQERENLSKISVRASNLGLLVLVFGLSIFLVASTGAELFVMRFSMLIVIFGLVTFLAGMEMGKALFIPVIYLSFMIPLPTIIWNKIAFPLKLFATKMAVSAIALLHIPVCQEGNIIHLSNTTLQVVDACSGMRSLASLLALSAAFAFITNHSIIKKWILFFAAIPIAVFLNVVRLSATAILAQHYGPQVAQGFLHDLSGLFVFVLAVLCLYVLHLILQKNSPVITR